LVELVAKARKRAEETMGQPLPVYTYKPIAIGQPSVAEEPASGPTRDDEVIAKQVAGDKSRKSSQSPLYLRAFLIANFPLLTADCKVEDVEPPPLIHTHNLSPKLLKPSKRTKF